MKQYQRIARWHIEQMTSAQEPSEVREGDRPLLDSTMVLFGSDPATATSTSRPICRCCFAGRAGGKLATGQHLKYGKDTPLSNLFVSMLTAFGTPVERFADSTGPLPGVLA
jgi:hypothetical protein